MINVAGGTEWRNEQYQLGAGDPASWAIGPYGEQGFSSASNGVALVATTIGQDFSDGKIVISQALVKYLEREGVYKADD